MSYSLFRFMFFPLWILLSSIVFATSPVTRKYENFHSSYMDQLESELQSSTDQQVSPKAIEALRTWLLALNHEQKTNAMEKVDQIDYLREIEIFYELFITKWYIENKNFVTKKTRKYLRSFLSRYINQIRIQDRFSTDSIIWLSKLASLLGNMRVHPGQDNFYLIMEALIKNKDSLNLGAWTQILSFFVFCKHSVKDRVHFNQDELFGILIEKLEAAEYQTKEDEDSLLLFMGNFPHGLLLSRKSKIRFQARLNKKINELLALHKLNIESALGLMKIYDYLEIKISKPVFKRISSLFFDSFSEDRFRERNFTSNFLLFTHLSKSSGHEQSMLQKELELCIRGRIGDNDPQELFNAIDLFTIKKLSIPAGIQALLVQSTERVLRDFNLNKEQDLSTIKVISKIISKLFFLKVDLPESLLEIILRSYFSKIEDLQKKTIDLEAKSIRHQLLQHALEVEIFRMSHFKSYKSELHKRLKMDNSIYSLSQRLAYFSFLSQLELDKFKARTIPELRRVQKGYQDNALTSLGTKGELLVMEKLSTFFREGFRHEANVLDDHILNEVDGVYYFQPSAAYRHGLKLIVQVDGYSHRLKKFGTQGPKTREKPYFIPDIPSHEINGSTAKRDLVAYNATKNMPILVLVLHYQFLDLKRKETFEFLSSRIPVDYLKKTSGK